MKLSIAIPTFNGHAHIKELIESINEQIEVGMQDHISFSVFENGSSENSVHYIKNLQSDFPNFEFFFFDENLGYDANLLRAANLCEGNFIWFIGDDDVLLEGALIEVLSCISNWNDLIVLNIPPSFFSDEIENRRHYPVVEKDYFTTNGQDFYSVSVHSTSALSSLVLKRDMYFNDELNKYMGLNWVHFLAGVLCQRIPNSTWIVLESDLIAVRTRSDDRWEHNFGNQYVSGLQQLNSVRLLVSDGVSRNTYRIMRDEKFKSNVIDLLSLANFDSNGQKKYSLRMLLSSFWPKPRFWLLDLWIFVLPNQIRKALFQLAKKIYQKFFI